MNYIERLQSVSHASEMIDILNEIRQEGYSQGYKNGLEKGMEIMKEAYLNAKNSL